jgi:hypothetical protein
MLMRQFSGFRKCAFKLDGNIKSKICIGQALGIVCDILEIGNAQGSA